MSTPNIVLIPKSSEADPMEKFRPIDLSNFKFKLISKIIVDRLAKFTPFLVYLKRKKVHTWEEHQRLLMFSLRGGKSHVGNLAINIDITKTFNTIV